MRGQNPYFLDFSDAPPAGRIFNWAWVAGTIFVLVLTIVGTLFIFPLQLLFPAEWQLLYSSDFSRSGYAESVTLWLTFVPAFIAPFLVYKYWHKLPFRRLLTFHDKFKWGRLFFCLGFVIAVYSVLTLIEFVLNPSEFDDVFLHPDWSGFAILLLVTFLLLPIQSASEEILCRGYLNQGLSLITKRPWIAFVLTSGFFAALHLANPEADGQVLPYMFDTFIFAMAMCWLSYADEGLESAIGVHIGNNLFVFALFGYTDPSLPPSAVWTAPEPTITWSDSIQGAVIIMSMTFAIIKFNQGREKRALIRL